MKMKKYNPFKMWGSWVGGIICLLLFSYKIIQELGITKKEFLSIFYTGGIFTNIFLLISFITIGFLIGWGIHSLIRRYK